MYGATERSYRREHVASMPMLSARVRAVRVLEAVFLREVVVETLRLRASLRRRRSPAQRDPEHLLLEPRRRANREIPHHARDTFSLNCPGFWIGLAVLYPQQLAIHIILNFHGLLFFFILS